MPSLIYCRLGSTKAAIGYVYDDSTEFPAAGPSNDQDDEESEADSDMDIGMVFGRKLS